MEAEIKGQGGNSQHDTGNTDLSDQVFSAATRLHQRTWYKGSNKMYL